MLTDEKDVDEELTRKVTRTERIKEDILDETFKKAEFTRKTTQQKNEKKKIVKKIFPKSGIIFIIIAIVALYFINSLPWMYVKYNTETGETDGFFYRDFKTEETEYNEVSDLLGSPCVNCSNNSHNYLGLSIDDFRNTPRITLYGLIALIILGLCFTTFAVVDKFRDFPVETVFVVYSTFAVGEIIAGIVILVSCAKFLGAYFLSSYNVSFIENLGLNDIRLVFLTPIILAIIASAIIKGAMTIININFKELDKKAEADRSQKSFSTYEYGSGIR